jgi:hypothetical protein
MSLDALGWWFLGSIFFGLIVGPLSVYIERRVGNKQ